MKTKIIIRQAIVLIMISTLSIVVGCKKDRKNDVVDPDTSSLQQLCKDDAQTQASDDQIMNDVNDVLSKNGGKTVNDSLPNSCTITIDTLLGPLTDTVRYTFAYNGYSGLHNFLRTGTVIVKKLATTHWKDLGATVWITYIDLQITKISSGKTFTFNGFRTYVNVLGGLIRGLGTTQDSVKHQITGSMQITFEDNTSRTWNIRRTRTYTGTYPSQLLLTVNGFGSDGGYNDLVEWGTNRNGETFYTQITSSVVFRETCDWDPCSGVKIHQIPSDNKKAVVTFGFDDNNQPITGTACPTKYQIAWTKGSNSGTIYLSLP